MELMPIDCPSCGAHYKTIEIPQYEGYYVRCCSQCLAQWVDNSIGQIILQGIPIFVDSQEGGVQVFKGR